MTAEPQPVRPSRTLVRLVIHVVLTLAGIIGGLFCHFVCQGMFSGYPRYGTGVLSGIGLVLIMAAGGVAWIIDHRRVGADDIDVDD
jgi:hypothetical protein